MQLINCLGGGFVVNGEQRMHDISLPKAAVDDLVAGHSIPGGCGLHSVRQVIAAARRLRGKGNQRMGKGATRLPSLLPAPFRG